MELRDWLESEGCTHVAMEATGVDWKLVWHVLESDEVTSVLAPFRDQFERRITIPGGSRTVAEAIAAEVGFDMSRFPTAAHLVSWAGLCPRMDESAGKRRWGAVVARMRGK